MGGMMGSAQTPAYDTMTINGKAHPATEPLHVERGERLRPRLVNASAEHTHVVRLAGHRLQVTHTDGNPLVQPVEVDAVPIAPSERYDVQVVASRPGAWEFRCVQPGHAEAGERVALQDCAWIAQLRRMIARLIEELGLEGDLATRIEAVERLGGLRPRQHDAETLAEERRLCYVGRATAIRDASVRARRGATPDSVA
jgi:Multicopper oxidase